MANIDYARLKALLEEQETFPHRYIHKIIGRNTPKFAEGVERLQEQFPNLKLETARLSKGEMHLALTYYLHAENADEVVALLEATHQLEDLHLIL